MGRLIAWLLGGLVLTVILSPLVLYFFGLSTRPMALPPPHLKQEDIDRVQRLLYQQQSPAGADGIITLSLGEQEINTAISYGLQSARRPELQGLIVTMDETSARLRGSVELPLGTERRFLNYEAQLEPSAKTVNITRLRLGDLPVPPALLSWVERKVTEQIALGRPPMQEALSAWEALDSMEIHNYQLVIRYRNSAAVRDSVAAQQRKLLLDRIDSELVDLYLAHLEPVSKRLSSDTYPLLGMLTPAFELARQRSADGGDPVMENTAAIVSLAMYAAEPVLLEVTRLDDRFGYPSRRLVLTLHRRQDLGRHFVSSALISLFAGERMAELAGLQKELGDTESGSGFDLADLMADKAGIRFAELSAASADSALRLQNEVAALVYDDELLPNPNRLPRANVTRELANLDESELEAYLAKLNSQVSQLLAELPIYQL